MVAKATTTAMLQGALTPTGNAATTAGIVESGVLTDGSKSFPGNDLKATPVSGGNLSGNYSYYVVFTNGNETSRPQLLATTTGLLANNSVTLSNFPTDNSNQWTGEAIYRSVNSPTSDAGNYYRIATLDTAKPLAGTTISDNTPDDQITGNPVMSFYGPPATPTTLLKDIVVYNPSTGTYDNAFPASGTLQFTGAKGGSTLATQSMAVNTTGTNLTTLKDLTTFLQGSLGIQPSPGTDGNNPIPTDSGSGLSPGVSITANGQIEIVSNDGTPESCSIGLSALQFVTGTGANATTTNVNIPFNSIQTAVGDGTTADMVAYDSEGIPLPVTITAVLEKTTSSYTEYRWYADCGQNDPGGGQTEIAVGTGTVRFDGQGNFLSASNTTISIGRADVSSVKPLQFNLDFSQVSGLAATSSSLTVSAQDGSAPGVLSSFIISNNGLINGVFSNGISRDLGQIRLARFHQSSWSGTARAKHVLCGRGLGPADHGQPGRPGHGHDRGRVAGIVQYRYRRQPDQPDYHANHVQQQHAGDYHRPVHVQRLLHCCGNEGLRAELSRMKRP